MAAAATLPARNPGLARRVNRAAISTLSRAWSSALSSRLPLYRPMAVLGQAEGVAETAVRGVPLRLLIEDYCDYAVLKHWAEAEPATLDWIDGFPPGARLLDVGASIGRFTLYAAARHPSIHVAAIEPDARSAHRLAKSITLNGARARVTNVLAAASDADGAVPMMFNYRLQQGHLDAHSVFEDQTFAYTVQALRIDTMVASGLVPQPTHIKIDVDGHEAAVLRGAAATLAAPALQSVLVEVDDTTRESVRGLMDAAGWRQASSAMLPSGLENIIYAR